MACVVIRLALLGLSSYSEALVVSLLARSDQFQPAARNASVSPAAPEGSEIIKGSDCGSVNKIIPMYQTAAEVGKLAGNAKGAMARASSAVEAIARAKTRAGEVAKALTETGELPQRVKLAADAADEAAAAATDASTALQTSLESFNGLASGSAMSGADVAETDKVELTKLTDKATAAAKTAEEAAAQVLEKIKEAEDEAMSHTASAAKLLQGLVDKADPLLKEMADVALKSEFAVKDAAPVVAKADEVASKIDTAASEAGDQAPVYEALKYGMVSEQTSVTEQQEAVTAGIEPVKAAATSLKGQIDKFRGVVAHIEGGAAIPSGQDGMVVQSQEIAAAEVALDEASRALSKLKGKVKTLIKRQGRLQSEIDKAKQKVL
jgi:hypothetical protein